MIGLLQFRRVSWCLILVALIGGCASSPAPRHVAFLQRAAANIDQGTADLDRAVSHARRSLDLLYSMHPELRDFVHPELPDVRATKMNGLFDTWRRNAAMMRVVSEKLRSHLLARYLPPDDTWQRWLTITSMREAASSLREMATILIKGAEDAAAHLEGVFPLDRAPDDEWKLSRDEIEQGNDAMRSAATSFGEAADNMDRAALLVADAP